MTDQWFFVAALVLLVVANLWGWKAAGYRNGRPFRGTSGRDGEDRSDARARAREIIAYLTATPSDRSRAP